MVKAVRFRKSSQGERNSGEDTTKKACFEDQNSSLLYGLR